MPDTSPFVVRAADWQLDETAIAKVRRRVFIEEQGVPETLEWERRDGTCRWFVATDLNGGIIATARITPEGRIGRMAVVSEWRRRGVGSALLAAIIRTARTHGLASVILSAQIHALPFYARYGFQARGDEYPDAGIPHRTMTLELD